MNDNSEILRQIRELAEDILQENFHSGTKEDKLRLICTLTDLVLNLEAHRKAIRLGYYETKGN